MSFDDEIGSKTEPHDIGTRNRPNYYERVDDTQPARRSLTPITRCPQVSIPTSSLVRPGITPGVTIQRAASLPPFFHEDERCLRLSRSVSHVPATSCAQVQVMVSGTNRAVSEAPELNACLGCFVGNRFPSIRYEPRCATTPGERRFVQERCVRNGHGAN